MRTPQLQPKTGSIPVIFWLIFCLTSCLMGQQINIDRIEMMSNMPIPYQMRDWRQVTLGYDALVFDLNAVGQYLPLIWLNTNTVNYPNHDSFGLHTVVGTPNPFSGEAINVLPAVIGASLVGVNKSDQNGHNWVLGCEEFFNRRPEENLYLNSPIYDSGQDWWYDTMPNVFFYQLYDLYPNTGDFAYQFTTIAERWLAAVKKMGGSSTPWTKPSMNYRAWIFSTMKPLTTGVPEPEAAGAIAWILYQAFVETGNTEYRMGAEWAMEFLNSRTTNPAYELQLPYGAYIAARMNAELGTCYDIEKLLNWCFEVGPLRQWGSIVGNWGGYDCSGLIGEANSSGYAFIMNGFEQVGALLPLIRYDDRFARAIGKWVLNIANASRLFYPNYLPDNHQDSEGWAHQYDPNSYIAHEAMRQSWQGISPYATGDAISGGWGATNLALYGSSHVGIFGGIIDTTSVPMILKLDVLKTDYFHDQAYPTYLYFNPYNETKTVQIDVGSGQHDLYDLVTNSFLQTNVSGAASFSIPADAAVVVVITPTGGTITYHSDQTLINGVIVDYHSGQPATNFPPRIKSLAAKDSLAMINKKMTLYATAADRDNDPLTYVWIATEGAFTGTSANVDWTAPNFAGIQTIRCQVLDGKGGQASDSIHIKVIDNQDPQIASLSAQPSQLDSGETAVLTCQATDPDGDTLTYVWSTKWGVLNGSGSVQNWIAPDSLGYFIILCQVSDGRGGKAQDSLGITVGRLVAYYPFNGNASDESGFGNPGKVHGAVLVEDRTGEANSAYSFNGVTDYILIPNQPYLIFQDAITVALWLKIGVFYSREAYPLSHGNWENRWKISITNHRVRWTVKTTSGIKDLDSNTELGLDTFYHIATTYNGAQFEIYVNGVLDAASTWSGSILPTSIDLTIGQVLPNDPNYNFKGVLDDIRIYNTGLSGQEIAAIYSESSAANQSDEVGLPRSTALLQNYPNPFNLNTTIPYQLKKAAHVILAIYDLLGQRITTLVDQTKPAGFHLAIWDGKNRDGFIVASGIYFVELQTADYQSRHKLLVLK